MKASWTGFTPGFVKTGAGFQLPEYHMTTAFNSQAITKTVLTTFIRCQFVVRVCHSVVVTPARNDHRLPPAIYLCWPKPDRFSGIFGSRNRFRRSRRTAGQDGMAPQGTQLSGYLR